MENETGKLTNWALLGLAVLVFLCSLPFAFDMASTAGGFLSGPMLGEVLVIAYAFGVFFLALLPLWRKCTGRQVKDAH